METLRDFGRDKLAEAGEQAQLRWRHRAWYTNLARRFEAAIISPRQPDWLTPWTGNCRTYVPRWRTAWPIRTGPRRRWRYPPACTSTGSSGRHREGRSWADRALAPPGRPDHVAPQGDLLRRRRDDLRTWINGEILLRLWPDLNLSRGVRDAWEDRHPALRPQPAVT